MKRLATLGALVLCAGTASAGLVDPALDTVLRDTAPEGTVSALLYLSERADIGFLNQRMDAERASLRRRHQVVVDTLRETAADTQGDLLAHLEMLETQGRVASHQPFWVVNAVRVDATPDVIAALAARPDVERAYFNHGIELVAPVDRPRDGANGGGGIALGGPEPGLVAIRADEVWALGITGDGVLVSNIDTGVDGAHSALASRWAGLGPNYIGNPQWAWYDPYLNQNTFPYDNNGHGTHTMGTITGGAPGDQVGVAPGAEWIAAAPIDRGGSIADTVSDAILSFQWIVDPDGNSASNWDVPAVCSNSWGVTDVHGYPSCDELFWGFVDAAEASGMIVVFAAGNEGFSGLRRPSDRATDEYRTFSVAALDGNNGSYPIAGFSSRGPTFCTPDGSAAIKPDIAAPGVSVRSSLPGGSYGTLSGTSMATPHIAGVVALVRQANPDLSVEQIKQIIFDSAVDLGVAGEDNDYGHGIVDAYEAVQLALETVGLTFSFPDGRPDLIDPAGGGTIRVVVTGTAAEPESGTGKLYYSTGAGYTEIAMQEVTPNTYDAVFPAFLCGSVVTYYFSADTTIGDTAFNPFSAPDVAYETTAYTGQMVTFNDDFEVDLGWTVTNVDLTDGGWERGVPAGGGDRGDPADDSDGSGQCFITDNEDGNSDVDGGPTILTSPLLDATGLPDAHISYDRWFTNDDGDADSILVELSNDGGASWTTLENVTATGAWTTVSHRIADFMTPTSQMRVRFSVTDNPNDSVTEAGIDAVTISSFFCVKGPPCPSDLDGDGQTAFTDLLALLAAWGPCVGCPEDLDADDNVGFADLLDLLASWGPCP